MKLDRLLGPPAVAVMEVEQRGAVREELQFDETPPGARSPLLFHRAWKCHRAAAKSRNAAHHHTQPRIRALGGRLKYEWKRSILANQC